jgi:hypothetical protein
MCGVVAFVQSKRLQRAAEREKMIAGARKMAI